MASDCMAPFPRNRAPPGGAAPSGNYVAMPSWQQNYPAQPQPPVAAVAAPPAPRHSWIVDTGATLHICSDKSLFDEYVDFPEPIPLQTAAGQSFMYGLGKIWLVGMCPTVLCLKDVGFVPNASHNLVSVGKLFDEGYSFATDCRGQMFALTNPEGQCVCAIERSRFTGLYCLSGVHEAGRIDHPPIYDGGSASAIAVKLLSGREPDCEACFGCKQSTKGVFACGTHIAAPAVVAGEAMPKDRLTLWHKRLGHLGSDSLERLVKENMVSGVNIPRKSFSGTKETCEPCLLGKQNRAPFATNNASSQLPGELLHMDLTGPMNIKTPEGYDYLLCIIDDHSRYSTVVPLKNKSDVKEAVMNTILLWENQLSLKVKKIRTDRGQNSAIMN